MHPAPSTCRSLLPRPRTWLCALLSVCVFTAVLPPTAQAINDTSHLAFLPSAGDIAAGQRKAAVCTACHGEDGNGNAANPSWPKIAGLDPSYQLKQLYAFAEAEQGCRNNPIMQGIVKDLSKEDMLDLAAYYGSKTMSTGYAEPEPLTLGEQLYRGGDRKRQITACIACHGPRGRGIASGKIPHLAGQHAAYTAAQLRAYQSEQRCTDPNKIMRTLAARLTEEDIIAVSNFIQGLY